MTEQQSHWVKPLSCGPIEPAARADGNRELAQRLIAKKVGLRPDGGRKSRAKSKFNFGKGSTV
jgi:hypothetical protein